MSDSYPEHLNPFAGRGTGKNKLGIRNSFRELKKTLRRSFRIKKKDDDSITIRSKPETPRPTAMSYSYSPEIALPRSRFKERLSLKPAAGPNPFDENEEISSPQLKESKRKPKKRAPLPPKSISSQDVYSENLEVGEGGSQWSLTSADTDYSYSIGGDMSRDDSEAELPSRTMIEKFKDFNKEMDRLKDDSNNNVITNGEPTKETSVIPDLVISCPSDSESIKIEEELKTDISDAQTTEVDVPEDISLSENKKIDVSDIKDSNLNDIPNISVDHVDNEVVYHENKTLFITGSSNNLEESPKTYTGKISLYISGSSDSLDACSNNNNESLIDNKPNHIDSDVEIDSCDTSTPIPKQRKNKLSKNILLGI